MVRYYNDTGASLDLFAVLDSSAALPIDTTFSLDVSAQALTKIACADTCAGTSGVTSLMPGTHIVDNIAAANDLDLTSAGCTGWPTAGADAMHPVTIPAGETLDVELIAFSGDPALYLLADCTDGATCVVGSDNETEAHESLSYTNTGSGAVNLYLVIDSWEGPGRIGKLTVSIQ